MGKFPTPQLVLDACDLHTLNQHCIKNRYESVKEITAWAQFIVPSTNAQMHINTVLRTKEERDLFSCY